MPPDKAYYVLNENGSYMAVKNLLDQPERVIIKAASKYAAKVQAQRLYGADKKVTPA